MKSLILRENPWILEEITNREMQYFTNFQNVVGVIWGFLFFPPPPPAAAFLPIISRTIRQLLCTYVVIQLFLMSYQTCRILPFSEEFNQEWSNKPADLCSVWGGVWAGILAV